MKNVNQLQLYSPLQKNIASMRYFHRKFIIPPKLNESESQSLKEIEDVGYTIIPNFVNPTILSEMQNLLQRDLEAGQFEMPALAQSKIDKEKHRSLIENHLFGNGQFYKNNGIAFDKEEFKSLPQVVNDFRPSTIKTYFNPSSSLFFNVMLNSRIMNIVESYMGLKPYLIEAYTRRNFKADYPVMNHYWHRDTNNPLFLIKAFFFLTDCDSKKGPHFYVKKSHRNLALNGKVYYSHGEVESNYNLKEDLVLSTVKAGTLVLEDTRGLHKAGIPEEGYRDLVYGVFMPVRPFSRWRSQYYKINENAYNELNERQKSYIPNKFVSR